MDTPHRTTALLRAWWLCCALTCFVASAAAQGIETRNSAVVLVGNTTNCTQPATIDFDEVKQKTPEWKTIRSEGIPPGSSRYQLEYSKMMRRIRDACSKVATSQGRDCVVREGDITNDNGLDVVDLTDDVVAELESGGSDA
ncbi:MAG: hypothetical protein IPM29_23605 [Planctomycetes bacterium]|nr:hypothetical protein [Planctomycetota bacterium]